MTENFCKSLLYKILEDMQTSEQPRSLAEFLMESPPVRRSNQALSLQQILFGLTLTQNLTFIQSHSPHPLQSERCEEKESEIMDLVEQILLFESSNEQI